MVIGWVLNWDKIQAIGSEDGPSAEDSGGEVALLALKSVYASVSTRMGSASKAKVLHTASSILS